MQLKSKFNFGDEVCHKLLPSPHYIVFGICSRQYKDIEVDCFWINEEGDQKVTTFYEAELEKVKERKIGFNNK